MNKVYNVINLIESDNMPATCSIAGTFFSKIKAKKIMKKHFYNDIENMVGDVDSECVGEEEDKLTYYDDYSNFIEYKIIESEIE